MSKSKYRRKLTAILSADVVGYSRLMGDDEEFTIQILNTYRNLMTTLIEDSSGSVVDAVGDNLLAEFTSVVDAVQCAVAIQTRLKIQNDKLAVSRHMLFRIGINIGDVIQEKDRIYGDGVNIAARIESLTEPGGVCISRGTYDHVKKKLDFGYEYIGEHAVKNISDPVRVYKVLMDPKDAGKRIKVEPNPPVKKSPLKKWLRITVSIILILFAVLAGVYWKYIYLPAPAGIDPEALMEFNLPEGPSIAVLPFDNMSNDPEQEYFCDGITENIILNLARSKKMLVIARNSTFAYKNKSINVQQIGRELSARYMIEGSIQKTNDLIRISVQLIDTESGHHIWSESYDRTFKDIFKLQDEITLEILKAVGIKLTGLGGDISIFEGINDIDSFIKIGKIRAYFENPTKVGFVSALKNVEEIITSNPEYPHRYDLFAVIYLTAIRHEPQESLVKRLFLTSKAVKKSLSLDENNFLAHQLKGWLFFNKREYDKAILAFKKSLDLNPLNADAYWAMGFALNSAYEPSKALENIKIAIRLNPISPPQYLIVLGWSYTLLKKYEKAIEAYKTILKRQPNHWYAYLCLVIPYAYSGQEKNAKIAVKKLLNFVPDYTITKYKKSVFFAKNQEARLEKAVKAFRKAGLPE